LNKREEKLACPSTYKKPYFIDFTGTEEKYFYNYFLFPISGM